MEQVKANGLIVKRSLKLNTLGNIKMVLRTVLESIEKGMELYTRENGAMDI